jgi:hypothetical protein
MDRNFRHGDGHDRHDHDLADESPPVCYGDVLSCIGPLLPHWFLPTPPKPVHCHHSAVKVGMIPVGENVCHRSRTRCVWTKVAGLVQT